MSFAHACLLALTALAWYVAGVSVLTTRVSYPLYTTVPPGAFVAYHRHYGRQIPPVVVAPAFVAFLGCLVLPLTRPPAVPSGIALAVAAGGLVAVLATVGVAIPSHVRLQRDGFTGDAYDRLRAADRVRTTACLLDAVLLGWSVLLAFGPR